MASLECLPSGRAVRPGRPRATSPGAASPRVGSRSSTPQGMRTPRSAQVQRGLFFSEHEGRGDGVETDSLQGDESPMYETSISLLKGISEVQRMDGPRVSPASATTAAGLTPASAFGQSFRPTDEGSDVGFMTPAAMLSEATDTASVVGSAAPEVYAAWDRASTELQQRVESESEWHLLRKQLRDLGTREPTEAEAALFKAKGSKYGLFGVDEVRDLHEVGDADLWGCLEKQLETMRDGVKECQRLHRDPWELEEPDGAMLLRRRVEASGLDGQLASLEVDVQEMYGIGRDRREADEALSSCIHTLQGHVGNAISHATRASGWLQAGRTAEELYREGQEAWQGLQEQSSIGSALVPVAEMTRRVTEMARRPQVSDRLDTLQGPLGGMPSVAAGRFPARFEPVPSLPAALLGAPVLMPQAPVPSCGSSVSAASCARTSPASSAAFAIRVASPLRHGVRAVPVVQAGLQGRAVSPVPYACARMAWSSPGGAATPRVVRATSRGPCAVPPGVRRAVSSALAGARAVPLAPGATAVAGFYSGGFAPSPTSPAANAFCRGTS